jgi:hypothetical protein
VKIYCVLCDAAYLPMNKMFELAKRNDATYLPQVSNSWTLSSLVPMLTGKLTSDILDHGLGWDYAFPEMVADHKQKWNENIVINDMLKNDWDIHYHNNSCIYELLYGDKNIKQTNINFPGVDIYDVEKQGLWKFEHPGDAPSSIWAQPEVHKLMFGHGKDSDEFRNREFEAIKNFQKEKITKNKFYFIGYQHLHMAYGKGREPGYEVDHNLANQQVIDLINAWDFNEPDSLFIFFCDHGNFRLVDRYMTPPHSWFSWALVKDNTTDKKIKKKMISIRDVYTIIADKINIDYSNIKDIENIFDEQNQDRIYFAEDGRSIIDRNKSTTASAIKAIDWMENGYPRNFLQVVYHKPENKFLMYLFDAVKEEIFLCDSVDSKIKRELINRFSWINPWIQG